MIRAIGILGSMCATGGCFRYNYVPLAEAPVGEEVRVHLSREGHARLSASVGEALPNLPRIVDGSLVQANAQQLLISVRVATDSRVASAGLRQRLAVPASDIQQLEVRQVDRKKVVLIGVGAGLALGAIIAHYVRGVFGGTTRPFPEPGPTELMQSRLWPSR
jgi:hypothetical protein